MVKTAPRLRESPATASRHAATEATCTIVLLRRRKEENGGLEGEKGVTWCPLVRGATPRSRRELRRRSVAILSYEDVGEMVRR